MITIKKPTLLLDENKCKSNIQRLVEKATKHDLRLRPHFKTHQSLAIGEWFRSAGVAAITVSSLKMATYFAKNGWADITIAFPFYAQQIDEINQLASEIDLNVAIVNLESLKTLKEQLDYAIGVYIKIDVGTHRTGLRPEDDEAITQTIQEIFRNPMLIFKGFMAHAGHSYRARGEEEIKKVHQDSLTVLQQVKTTCVDQLSLHDEPLEISLGDTPGFSVAEHFPEVDEVRPGNLAFYDVMQTQIGACDFDQIAVAMACPVVAKHADRHEIVIHGGAVHFSKDYILDGEGNKNFGQVVNLREDGWGEPIPDMQVVRLSQEHGIIKTSPETFDTFQVGDVLGVLPIHSCLTADAMKSYTTFDGRVLDHLEGQSL